MTTPNTDLAEQDLHDKIVDKVWEAAAGRSVPFDPHTLAAAVLPIVDAAVKRGQAEALREAANDAGHLIEDAVSGSQVPAVTAEDLLDTADRIEKETPDEH